MHGIPIVVGAVVLVLIIAADFLVVRNLPKSRGLPRRFLSYFVFMPIVAGLAVGVLTRGR